ncbi:MAG: 5-bromo-4-chloroindolyl phosphate hydrolysis family protein, partial [Clostridia bacterium]|nr:5-bromo-4-chloroindolyl phosphate hydrolysis family protein [Clostridia bacterium]
MNNGKSGCLGTVAVILVIILLIKIAPMLLTLIKIGMILTIVGIVALVVLVIYFSTRKTNPKQPDNQQNAEDEQSPKEEEPDPALSEEQNAILKQGRAHLMELRRRMTHVKHVPIRTVCGNICSEAEKILAALRKKPEKISQVRQFLNYYLPTLGSILEKYVRLEENDALTESMTDNTLEHLNGKGFDVSVKVPFTVNITTEDGDKLNIRVTAEFEEEVILKQSVSTSRHKIGFLKYDYSLNASFEVGNYTGINFSADIDSADGSNESMSEILKVIMKQMEDYQSG